MSTTGSDGRREHWERRYRDHDERELSWYLEHPRCALELFDDAGVRPADPVIDVGAGSSRLIDALLARGFADVTALDVAGSALAAARHRLGADADRVRWEVADLLYWQPARRYAVWHDRAVFHFLVDPRDRDRYRERLAAALAPGGLAVIATFAQDGPRSCSGLPTAGYAPARLAAEFADLQVLGTRREVHRTPAGAAQPFTWVALRVS
jgi:SAM-dependent methyltransferase